MVLQQLFGDLRSAVNRSDFSKAEKGYAVCEILANHVELLDRLDHRCELERGLILLQMETSKPVYHKVYVPLANFYKRLGESQLYLNDCFKRAVLYGDVRLAKLYLRKGAKINSINWSQHEWFVPGSSNTLKEMLTLLYEYGLNFYVSNCENNKLLYKALECSFNDGLSDERIMEITEMITNSGVSVNALHENGCSPLFLAIEWSRSEIVSFLIKKGADVNIESMFGELPLFCAVAFFDGDTKVIDSLLNNGANVGAKNKYGVTALHIASLYCLDERVIGYLTGKGADITVKNNDGNTPLSLLTPDKDNFDECMNAMAKEFALLKFKKKFSSISESDIKIILKNPNAKKYFERCISELDMMFYGPYSTYSVLMMSRHKNKKLVNLLRNDKIMKPNFQESLMKISYYQSDLQRAFEEALVERNNLLIVETRLYSIFKNILPDVVIRELRDNLNVSDLPQQL